MSGLTEEAIRPEGLMEAKRGALERDRAWLRDRRGSFVEVACPACGGSSRTAFGEKDGFSYARCLPCETVYQSPRADEATLREFYEGSENYRVWNETVFPATETARREMIFAPRAERLKEHADRHGARSGAGPGGTLIDVGAAFGTMCQEVVRAGVCAEAVALEPTPDLARTCRERGLRVIESSLEACEERGVADIVTAFEVIEHVFDPGVFLDGCRGLLREGGLLVLSCPNVKGFDVATLGLASGTFDHEHLNYFHSASLSGLVSSRGFRVVETLTPGELDAGIVAKAVDSGSVSLDEHPFLKQVFVDRREELLGAFQGFLREHGLSSHLWLVAVKEGG